MFYIGIYTNKGKVDVSNVYEDANKMFNNLHPSFQILKVCEAPTKSELDNVVKKALQDYRPLPGLTSEEEEFTLTYTVNKVVRVAGKTAESRKSAAKYLSEVYQRSLEREGFNVIGLGVKRSNT